MGTRHHQAAQEIGSSGAKLTSLLQQRIGLRLAGGFVSAVVVLIFLALLTEWVLEGETQRFDDEVLALVHRHTPPILTAAMKFVTTLGSTAFLLPLGVCVGVIFLIAGRQRAVTLFAITMAGAALLTFTLKLSFRVTRPQPFFDIHTPGSYSFPSGHALSSFCFYGALAAIIADRTGSRTVRVLIWSLAVALIAVIGFSRIYLGVHYPSDVLAGYGAAFVWVMFVAFVDRFLKPLTWTMPQKRK
jgi:undecaprenyl-diphosphatase